jgi:hypothetical protein
MIIIFTIVVLVVVVFVFVFFIFFVHQLVAAVYSADLQQVAPTPILCREPLQVRQHTSPRY